MKKIIIINDCKFESVILKDILDKLNYEVKIAGETVSMETIEKFSPDILIVNYIMKEFTGDYVIQKIKEIYPYVKGILCSNNIIFLKDFKDKGVDAVLHTPIDINRLKIVLKLIDDYSIEGKNEQKPTYAFCPFCGKPLENVKDGKIICSNCGKELKMNSF